MAAARHRVTIKGVRDGLVFILNDSCDFAELVDELRHKLEKTHQTLLSGPPVAVHVRFGKRAVTEAEKEEVLSIIRRQGNLVVRSVDCPGAELAGRNRLVLLRGVVRSGQIVRQTGSVLYLGDVNPGGVLVATGDIYVMGALRGTAHAGADGDERAIIAASYMKPTQLRIAGVISRPAEEWGVEEAYMEFAYLRDGRMEIDKLVRLSRVRPDVRHPFEGEE